MKICPDSSYSANGYLQLHHCEGKEKETLLNPLEKISVIHHIIEIFKSDMDILGGPVFKRVG